MASIVDLTERRVSVGFESNLTGKYIIKIHLKGETKVTTDAVRGVTEADSS